MTALLPFVSSNFQAGDMRGQPCAERVHAGRAPASICQTNPPWALIVCPLLSLWFLFSGKQLWCLAEVQWASNCQNLLQKTTTTKTKKRERDKKKNPLKTTKEHMHKEARNRQIIIVKINIVTALIAAFVLMFSTCYPSKIKGLICSCCIIAEILSKAICSK